MLDRLFRAPLLLAVLIVVAAPATASADYRAIYKECTDGTLENRYSATELKTALQRMGAYERDYTNCTDAIYMAQTSGKKPQGNGAAPGGAGSTPGSGTGGGGTGGGGGTDGTGGIPPASDNPIIEAQTATPDESQASTAQAIASAEAAEKPGETLPDVQVPAAALNLGASGAVMPLPLLIALIAGGIAALAGGGVAAAQALRRRFVR